VICHGNGPDHCCSLGQYGVCQYLEENTVEGRRWACGLLRELGAWSRVHVDGRYLRDVKPKLDELGVVDCGDWPQNVPELFRQLEAGTINRAALCCWGDD